MRHCNSQIFPVFVSPCDGKKVGVEVITLLRDDLTSSDLAVLATETSYAIPEVPVMIDGVETDIVEDPQFQFQNGNKTTICES